jgi:hypothetical protein
MDALGGQLQTNGGANGKMAGVLIRGLKDAINRYKMSFPAAEVEFLEQVWQAYQGTVGGEKPELFDLRCSCWKPDGGGTNCSCDNPIIRPVAQCSSENLGKRLDAAVEYDDLRIMEARDLLNQLDNDGTAALPDSALRQVVLELRDWVLVDLPPDLLQTKAGWKDRLRCRIDYLREIRMIEELDPEHRLSMYKKMKSEKTAVEREQRLSTILRRLGEVLEHWILEKEKDLAQRRSAELLAEVILKVRTVLGNSLKALPYILNDTRTNSAVDLTTLEKYLHGEVKSCEFSAITEYVGKGHNRLYHRLFAPLGHNLYLRAALSDILPHAADEQGKREMAARRHTPFSKAGEKDANADDIVDDFASVELATAQLLALVTTMPKQLARCLMQRIVTTALS